MIAAWLRPMLWRERDWRPALARVAAAVSATGPDSARRAGELGRASEHIDPDRGRAIAAYATGGGPAELARARALACEQTWWPVVARLALLERQLTGDAGLAVDEFEAWLDADQRVAAATVAAAAVAAAPDDPRIAALALAVRGAIDPVVAHRRIAEAGGGDARTALTIARLARLAGDRATLRAQLAAAAPGDARAALLWLAVIDDDAIPALVQAQLADLEPAAWVTAARRLGFALLARPGTRGLALRLMRAALTTAYQHQLTPDGHLAMWTVLVEHAAQAGARSELLGLAAVAVDAVDAPDDRLWLAALGAAIAWEDAGALAVAQQWAAVVAELVPDHPIVGAVVAAGHAQRDRDAVDAEPAVAAQPVHTALAAARDAVATVEEAASELDLELGELAAAGPADVALLTAAVDAAATAAAHVAAPGPAPARPAPSLIPAAARSALGRIPGQLPSLPPLRPPANPRPRAPRIAVPLDATVERVGHPPIAVVCRDISATGVFVLTDAALVEHELVELTVHAPTDRAWVERTHRVQARVVRRATGGYGLELSTPSAELVAALSRLAGA